jgi:phage shock protein A
MKKRLQNMERLCQKMQARYGAQDTMVMQLLNDLATLKLQIKQYESAKPDPFLRSTTRPRAGYELH